MEHSDNLLRQIYLRGDRLSLSIVWAGFVVCLGLASWYDTWMAALLIALPAALIPSLSFYLLPGERITRCILGAAFMVLSAVMIHESHGMIEMHFSIFCLLAALVVYRDWLVVITAAAVIAVHHLLFNYLQIWGYGVWVFPTNGSFGLVLLHAAFVIFESAVLILLTVTTHKEAIEAMETRAFGSYLVMQDGRINLNIEQTDASSEFGQQFSQYLGALQSVVGELDERSQAISHASTEIASGNLDLSGRTEQQAAALEETSASMTEMMESARQNAENAERANKLVDSAREQAERGGSVVYEAVDAMEEITESSKRIGSITNVIDEIAFQTNLLALNAAVEAARAGEQGRGFAVVASEVRSLAARSAEAAKEIKMLIDESVTKVRNGSELVNRSGTTLQEIVEAVKRVSVLVSEIASSSVEQTEGIEMASKTTISLDQMTQQNAALVEQVAAAAKELEEQAFALSAMMGRFALPSAGYGDTQYLTQAH